LSAAQQTVEDHRGAHSLHAYFLRAGDIGAPIVYNVERTRDGRSFSTRRVIAIQHGEQIFNCTVSFQIEEPGFEHQMTMPNVPQADALPSRKVLSPDELEKLPPKLQRWLGSKGPFELRYVEPRDEFNPGKLDPVQHIWFRLVDRIGDSPTLHRAMVAYASDFNLIGSAMLPHGISWLTGKVQLASLDHAMWFHRPFRADEWLLYSLDSPTAQGARGLARGQIFSADGRLVASTAQEGMMRLAEGK